MKRFIARIVNLTYFFGAIALMPIVAHANIKMAVTIDDLPATGKMPAHDSRISIAQSIITTLKSNHIPEVYGFINGKKTEKEKDNQEVLKLWVQAGYPLGNHSYSHQDISKSSIDGFKKEIDENEGLLSTVGGKLNWHFFRFPFLHEGDTLKKRNAIREYLKEKNYTIAQVTDDFEDWDWNDPYARCKDRGNLKAIEWLKSSYLDSAEKRLARDGKVSAAIWNRPINHILLLHIGAFDAVMLPALLKMYREKGVEFIPLSEAVTDSIYKQDPGMTMKSGDRFQYQFLRSKGMTLKSVGINTPTPFPEKELQNICI